MWKSAYYFIRIKIVFDRWWDTVNWKKLSHKYARIDRKFHLRSKWRDVKQKRVIFECWAADMWGLVMVIW